MRTIILGLLGATMLSSVAQAACNDIPNPTRFNPTELSEYQECWLDEYKADEDAGVLGSLAWVRLNDEYFSASLSMIRKNPGNYSEKFLAAIEDQLADYTVEENEARIEELTVIVKIVEKIVENGETINALRAEIKRLESVNADLNDMIADKNSRINELLEENTSLEGDIIQLELDVEWYKNRAKRAVSFVSQLHNQAVGGYAPSANGTWIDHADYVATYYAINDMKSTIASLQLQITSTPDITAVQSTDSNVVTQIETVAEDVDTFAPEVNDTASPYHADAQTALDNIADGSSVVTIIDNDYGTFDFVDLNGTWVQAQQSHYYDTTGLMSAVNTIKANTALTTLDAQLGAAYTQGYNDGYEDGYDQGYVDGYADGANGRDASN